MLTIYCLYITDRKILTVPILNLMELRYIKIVLNSILMIFLNDYGSW